MLIYEITQPRSTPVDEGFMDQAKAMAKRAGQGATDFAKKAAPVVQQSATDFAKKAGQVAAHGGKTLGTKVARSAPVTAMRSARQTAGNIGKGTGTGVGQEYQLRKVANKAQISWNKFKEKYAGSLHDEQEKQDYLSGKDGLLHDQLTDFIEKNFLGGKPTSSFANGRKIDAIINKISGIGSGQSSSSGSQREQPARAASTPTAAKPTKRSEKTVSPRGAKVVSGEPRVLRFQGVDYIRNERGEWANFKTGRPAPEGQQAFLNKEDDYFDAPVTEGISGLDPNETQLFVDLTRQAMLATTARQNSAQQRDTGAVRSTGNPSADAVLQQAGFVVK